MAKTCSNCPVLNQTPGAPKCTTLREILNAIPAPNNNKPSQQVCQTAATNYSSTIGGVVGKV